MIERAYGLPSKLADPTMIPDEVKDAWRAYVMAIIGNYKVGNRDSNFGLIPLTQEEKDAAQKGKVEQDRIGQHPNGDEGWQAPEASRRYCTECGW